MTVPKLHLLHSLTSDSSVISDFSARFTAYQADPASSPLHADSRSPAYRSALRTNSAATVAALKKEWYSTPAIDGKELCLTALGHVGDAGLISSVLLPFLFSISPPVAGSEAVPPVDMHILGSSMASNREARPLLWAFMRDNWESAVIPKVGGNPIVLDRFVQVTLGKFSDLATLKEIDEFFRGRDTAAFDRTLGTVKDRIRGRAAYRERDAGALREWLGANGYA